MLGDSLYWVRVMGPDGQVFSRLSRLGARDEVTARVMLETQTGGTVLALHPLPPMVAALWERARPVLSQPLPPEALADYFHNLGVMLRSGLPIDMALADLAKDPGHASMRRFAAQLHAGVVAGHALSYCLKEFEHQIPMSVRALVGIGEKSGELDNTLVEAGAHIKRLQRIRRDVGKALIYPAFALLTITVAILFWVYYVLPDLSRMFLQMGVKLPRHTQAVMEAVTTLQESSANGLFMVLAAGVLGVALLLRTERVKRGLFALLYRLPISGLLIRSSSMAYITEYLALLIKAGIPLTHSLEILARNVRNPFYAEHLENVRQGVNRGNLLSAEMKRTGVFPAMVTRLVTVGEQTGTLDEQLDVLSKEHARRFEHVIESLSEILKPLLIVITGVFFIFIVVVFLLPVYDLIAQVIR